MRVYALEVDGTCEVIEFLDERLQESLAADLRSIILHIAAHGFRTPRNWYRRLVGWPNQWEVRKGRHRLLGFVDGEMLILCLQRLKKGQELPAGDFARVARLQEAWLDERDTPGAGT